MVLLKIVSNTRFISFLLSLSFDDTSLLKTFDTSAVVAHNRIPNVVFLLWMLALQKKDNLCRTKRSPCVRKSKTKTTVRSTKHVSKTIGLQPGMERLIVTSGTEQKINQWLCERPCVLSHSGMIWHAYLMVRRRSDIRSPCMKDLRYNCATLQIDLSSNCSLKAFEKI